MIDSKTDFSQPPSSPPLPRFNFILQPEFPINALILASEALRIANQNSGKTLFYWSLVSSNGEAIRASNGMWLDVDYSLKKMPEADYYFVFEGNLPTQNNSPELLSKLREARRSGATVGGIDTGAFALVQAGMNREDSIVVHWEAAATFHERFPQLQTSDELYHINGNLLTCAGGVATLDLMLALIRQLYSDTLAIEVANALVHQIRPSEQTQRIDTDSTTTLHKQSLSEKLLTLMENNLDFPLTTAQIAEQLGVSSRTLERHCKRHFGYTPMRLYLGVRLQAARNFLFYEDYSIKDVALAYGFSSPAIFSRTFKVYFGQTPTAFRASIRNLQSQTQTRLPEIRRLYSSSELPAE